MGLKKELTTWIRNQGEVSYKEIEEYCKENYYKVSNAERCLRPSSSPQIEAIKKKRYITGYRWIGSGMEAETKEAFKEAKEGQGSLKL
jgi:hypothetical protein|tara:strand:- start:2289 stop:2552 length:264 start_codon:yes stop_codon:yes gene_type:complete